MAIKQLPNRGEKLENGATVIDSALGKTYPIVLAMWRSEFVTWDWNAEEGYIYAGNYFTDILAAAKDFKKRLNG